MSTVARLDVATYTVPTDAPEADGTLEWDSTTLVVVHAYADDGTTGLGWSAHCAPALHTHVAAAAPNLRHLEYFHDHVRIEHLLFDGVLDVNGGGLVPDQGRPGLGPELRPADAEPFRVG